MCRSMPLCESVSSGKKYTHTLSCSRTMYNSSTVLRYLRLLPEAEKQWICMLFSKTKPCMSKYEHFRL